MSRILLAAAVVLMAVFTWTSPAQASERTLKIDGVVRAPGILIQANQLLKWADEPEPVTLIINSPGGAVYAGLQFINAMEVARSKGVRFDCYVPGMAASMAFQILAHCDRRYTLAYSLLLWHPVRVTGLFTLTPYDAKYLAWTLREIEQRMMPKLYETLGDKKFVNYHYVNETMWTGAGLEAQSPNFLEVVSDMPFPLVGLWEPGKMQGQSTSKDITYQITWAEFEIGGEDTKPPPSPTPPPAPSPAPDCRSCHTKPHGEK